MTGLEVDELRRAADLISQPYLPEVLMAAKSGGRPSTTVPADADPRAVDAVVQRLTEFGAVFPRGGGGADEPLALTDRGQELLRLLHEAANPADDGSRPADGGP